MTATVVSGESYHFGLVVPGEGKERIEASCVLGMPDITEGLVACSCILANLYDVVWKGCVAPPNELLDID